MKPTTILVLSIIFIYQSPLHAQVDKDALTGTWQLELKTDNSPFAGLEGLSIEPPGTDVVPASPRPKREPFQKKWAFDGTYAYILRVPSVTQVMTYTVDTGQLTLHFKQAEQFELISCSDNRLVVAKEQFFGSYMDTLYFTKINAELPDFAKYQRVVHQRTLADFQLHGVYEHVLNRDDLINPSSRLGRDNVVSLNLRFYPDSTLVFGLSLFHKDAEGFTRGERSNKLDADLLPYPFGEYTLQNEGASFYFQPDRLVVRDDSLLIRIPETEISHDPSELRLADGKLILSGFQLPGFTTASEQEFTFVPFRRRYYFFDK